MPETVEEWIAELEAADKLTPETMVAEAIDPDHVAHGQFEWDDSAAAHAHRLWQARQLVARYTVTIESGSGRDTRIRAYVNVPSEGRYMRTDRAAANPAWRDELIAEAKRAARYFTVKYKSLGDQALLDLVAEALKADAA